MFLNGKYILAALACIAFSNAQSTPELCTDSNQGDCECGRGDVKTYVFKPGAHKRCIHTYIPDESEPLPVLVMVSGYNQGKFNDFSEPAERARYYGYALIGVGSTGPFDGGGNFGLEFPANGVINHLNPTPCTEADSREYSYIEGVLDFIAGNSALDASKVYFEGFSQSSMFAAYVGVCFADRVAGIFQGGSGLAKTFHKPIVPGFQAQCSASVFSEYGRECCNENFCTDCTWWPIYPRTCDNKLIDCIAAYTNDNIACGTDYYMYEAMVAEENDARMLSFSPDPSSGISGMHKNPENKYSWMVGCLGIVDSCSAACETSFLNCMTSNGVDKFSECESELADGNLANCDPGCAPTLEMLKTSETPVVSLSEGKFGTQSGLDVTKDPPKPECAKEFGSFDDVGVDFRCRPQDGQGPAEGEIESCGDTLTTPAPSDSPSDCEDSTLDFKQGKNYRNCDWVKLKKNNRCKKKGISAHCSQTCDSCSVCEDTTKKFKVTETVIRKCKWAKNTNRCNKTGVSEACPKKCGVCE